ncbi:uncharacterized protein EDB93DRAFT_1091637, partial [Suillus bovinus]|uniref:uncharacterized protein n=1 Tax=Suillus bovinus TaxID=48563 RepID=UPI001B878BF6
DIQLVIQWGYTGSLCALMQHLGCAARDPAVTAIAMYFVEQEYFDTYKGKWRRTADSSKKQCLQKSAKVVRSGHGNTTERLHDENEGSTDGDSTDDDNINDTDSRIGIGNNTEGLGVSQILPTSLDNGEYETVAMAAFINGHLRGFCHRRVADEYFDNTAGTTIQIDLMLLLTE